MDLKKMVLSALFCLTTISLHGQSALLQWLKELVSTQDFIESQKDYDACGRLIDQEIEYLLQPGMQRQDLKNDINQFKDKARKDILFTLKNRYQLLTKTKAKSLSKEMARAKAIEYLQERAIQITKEKLNNPPINPSLFDKNKVIETIKNDIDTAARTLIINKGQRLTGLLQNLSETVQTRLSVYFNQLSYPTSSNTYDTSYSSNDDDIKEIYPKLDIERNETFFNESAIKKRKKLRDEEKECPVCLESFADRKARTNLFCGHFICPSCAYVLLYNNTQQPECPICRHPINTAEFPQNYLRQFYKP